MKWIHNLYVYGFEWILYQSPEKTCMTLWPKPCCQYSLCLLFLGILCWPNGSEAGWMVYKQREWHESCTSLLSKQLLAQTAWKLAKLFPEASTNKQNHLTNTSADWILKVICAGVSWFLCTRLRLTWQELTSFPVRVLWLLPVAFIGTYEGPLTMCTRC